MNEPSWKTVIVGFLFGIIISVAGICTSGHDKVEPFYVGESTWESCGGGVLPDQVEVPEPEPMP